MTAGPAVLKIVGILLIAGSPFFVQAQLLDPVSVSLEEVNTIQVDDERIHHLFTVVADIEDGWYLYSLDLPEGRGPLPTGFFTLDSQYRIDGDIRESPAEMKYDPNFDRELGMHSGSARFEVPVKADPALGGSIEVRLNIRYQSCDDRSCLPPVVKDISYELPPGSEDLSVVGRFNGADRGIGTVDPEITSAGEDRSFVRGGRSVMIITVALALLAVLFSLWIFRPVKKR